MEVLRETAGEKLLWVGTPKTNELVGEGLTLLTLTFLSGFLCLFLETPDRFFYSGLGFALFFWVGMRFVRQVRLTNKTVYGVSQTRIIIIRVGPTTRVVSFIIAHIDTLETDPNKNEFGNLYFESSPRGLMDLRMNAFHHIREVEKVKEIIRRAKDSGNRDCLPRF
jgi:hypothetical protein